jgi:hypothetical protein
VRKPVAVLSATFAEGRCAPNARRMVAIMQVCGRSRLTISWSTVVRWRPVARLTAAFVLIACLMLGSSSATASASSDNADNASCVEKFNVAVGTPGEYQRVFHQAELGRDVSFFARLGEDCPFG